MSDDKHKEGAGDRARVSASEDYEVEYFARKHGITPERTRELIAAHHGDRKQMEEALSNVGGE